MTDSATDTPLSRLFVLVIEDEPFTRTVVAKLVETLGCARVEAAENAVAGLAILRQDPVEVPVDVVVRTDLLARKRMKGLEIISSRNWLENHRGASYQKIRLQPKLWECPVREAHTSLQKEMVVEESRAKLLQHARRPSRRPIGIRRSSQMLPVKPGSRSMPQTLWVNMSSTARA